ncbi:MAG: DNA alkylation repair protein [Bacteroidetes bacterium]|nr:DNA alkylation repair protein [Bacteroidota bacterium]
MNYRIAAPAKDTKDDFPFLRLMESAIQSIYTEMQKAGNAKEAAKMAKYMKDRYPYFGVKSPARKEIQKAYFPIWKKEFKGREMEMAQKLWNKPEREMQYVAMDWMKSTSIWKIPGAIEQIETWICHESWWDSVDFLASTCVGGYFLKFPGERDIWIEKWNNSPDFWLNRTAIIFQLKYKSKIDTDLMFAVMDTHKGQKEFFIRKAIGWALRELSKTQPEKVREYLSSRELSGLSVREASKYL